MSAENQVEDVVDPLSCTCELADRTSYTGVGGHSRTSIAPHHLTRRCCAKVNSVTTHLQSLLRSSTLPTRNEQALWLPSIQSSL